MGMVGPLGEVAMNEGSVLLELKFNGEYRKAGEAFCDTIVRHLLRVAAKNSDMEPRFTLTGYYANAENLSRALQG
jgi:hypothetical protein